MATQDCPPGKEPGEDEHSSGDERKAAVKRCSFAELMAEVQRRREAGETDGFESEYNTMTPSPNGGKYLR
jgi:hypothetical protein